MRPLLVRCLAAGFVLAAVSSVSAQITEDPTLPAPRGPVEIPEFRHILVDDPGIDAVMRLDFARADSIFSARRKLDPQDPGPVLGLGLNEWWRGVSSHPDIDLDQVESFLEETIRLARGWQRRGDREKAEGLYYSGRANSLLSSYHLIRGNKMKAARAAQRAKSELADCLDQEPEYHDAKLGLGLYHYYSDALPRFFKLLGWVFGVRGDREQGLAELRAALDHGRYTAPEAGYFLANVLANFENRPAKALGIIRLLAQTYPQNHIFFLEYQNVLESLGYYAEAEANLRDVVAPDGPFSQVRAVRLMLGRNLYRQARYPEGAAVLTEVLHTTGNQDDPTEPWIHYFAARCYDLGGDRASARPHYEVAASSELGGNVSELAKDRLGRPEGEAERRIREARGVTRQRDRAEDAARLWQSLIADIESGRLDSESPLDVLRFRHGLCLEEAGQYDRARRVYKGVTDEVELRDRAALGAARCLWRQGQVKDAVAALDALAQSPGFGGRAEARRLRDALVAPPCKGREFPNGTAAGDARMFIDPEAWMVEIHAQGENGESCAPMTWDRGVWRGHLPVPSSEGPYYYLVDLTRREPDPLSRWVRDEENDVWSVVAQISTLAERPAWYQAEQ